MANRFADFGANVAKAMSKNLEMGAQYESRRLPPSQQGLSQEGEEGDDESVTTNDESIVELDNESVTMDDAVNTLSSGEKGKKRQHTASSLKENKHNKCPCPELEKAPPVSNKTCPPVKDAPAPYVQHLTATSVKKGTFFNISCAPDHCLTGSLTSFVCLFFL
ncbi:MAG: hypothetical protein SGARI_003286 [Bacillariaceae sp.]